MISYTKILWAYLPFQKKSQKDRIELLLFKQFYVVHLHYLRDFLYYVHLTLIPKLMCIVLNVDCMSFERQDTRIKNIYCSIFAKLYSWKSILVLIKFLYFLRLFYLCSENDLFKCNNGEFTKLVHKCNGLNDCGDISDEQDCGKRMCMIFIFKKCYVLHPTNEFV